MDGKMIVYGEDSNIIRNISFLFQGEGLQLEYRQDKDLFQGVARDMEATVYVLELKNGGDYFNEVCRLQVIRDKTDKPILVVGENMSEMMVIAMLNAGADDCVQSGCTPLELLARVKAQARRYARLCSRLKQDNIVRIGNLEIDDQSKTVSVEGKNIFMTPMEYKILYCLAKQQGKVLSTKQIYEEVWHMKAYGADNTVAVHVRHIREKIEANPEEPQILQLVWGQGYKVG